MFRDCIRRFVRIGRYNDKKSQEKNQIFKFCDCDLETVSSQQNFVNNIGVAGMVLMRIGKCVTYEFLGWSQGFAGKRLTYRRDRNETY